MKGTTFNCKAGCLASYACWIWRAAAVCARRLHCCPVTYGYNDSSRLAAAVNSVETLYAANALNQYASIVLPSVSSVQSAVNLTPLHDAGGAVDTVRYVWGTDLSGTMQGAGGVGGLLFLFINGVPYIPCHDANGNITAYVNASGTVVASYTHDAFGNLTSQSGSMADAFRFRFSTKYHDPETGLYYYGYRFYDPPIGRWLNRDPIEERGGLNLHGFVGNAPANQWDRLGLSFWNCCNDCTETIIDATTVRIFPASHDVGFISAQDKGPELLGSLGASGSAGSICDLAMSITSLSGVLLSAAKIAIGNGMTAGADGALESGLHKFQSNLDKGYFNAAGYLALVSVKYRACDKRKLCWKLDYYTTFSKAKTKKRVTLGMVNPDPAAYRLVEDGYQMPQDAKAFSNEIKKTIKELVDGL